MWKPNANNAANSISRINDLKTVNNNDNPPLPIDWNMFPASTPKGISNKKKLNIRNASTSLGPKTELSAEYENINYKGSANINKHAQIIVDAINPNLAP